MAFPKSTLLAVIAASAALYNADAFAPASSMRCQSNFGVATSARFSPLSVSQITLGDDLATSEDDEPAPEDFIVSAGDLDGEAADADEDDLSPPDWYTHEQRVTELRQQYRRHETDTGSPEFQVAGMTERITYLTKHLKAHPKDFSTRRGLVALVNKRRRLLNYLFREDVDRYRDLTSSLGIRHKAPGRVQSREEKYGRFPPQKEKKNK